MLELSRNNFAAAANMVGVIKPLIREMWTTNRQGWTVGTCNRQRLDLGHCGKVERRFHHKVLRRIASDEHLWQSNHICARSLTSLPSSACFGRVSGKVPDGGVQLGHCQAECLSHLGNPSHFTSDVAEVGARGSRLERLVRDRSLPRAYTLARLTQQKRQSPRELQYDVWMV